jgi:isopenicillin-N N-acyltransferase like protein
MSDRIRWCCRWCLRLLVGLSILMLVAWLGLRWLMLGWVAPEPELAELPAIVDWQPEHRDGRVYLGKNWFGRRDGIQVLYLTGSAFEMGYANGVLTQDLIHQQEKTILRLVHQVAPLAVARFLLQAAVVYKNRHLYKYVPEAQRLEMLGLSRGCPDAHPRMGPQYNRIVSFHAAQDISYMLMHSRWAVGACTAFGAWGDFTVDGHLLCGRNFDWEADPIFDRERVLVLCEPDEGIPFISLAWAGMVGSVSGMNREGLSVTVNGAPSRLPSEMATPTCLVAREVLQYARTLSEATHIIAQSQVFVSGLFLVGSRHDGRFIVVEKTPELTAVRGSDATPWIVCANHYLTPELAATAVNQEALTHDTSQPRHDRTVERLEALAAPLDPLACADILRDQRLPGGRFAGHGHRSTLNALIATHAVVMDLTAGVLWAGAPPHQLGEFVAFDVHDFSRKRPARNLPADPMLHNGLFNSATNAAHQLKVGWAELKAGRAQAAEAAARLAATDNPGFYGNAWLLAAALKAQDHHEEALAAAREALAGQPALGRERRDIRLLLESLGGSPTAALPALSPVPDRTNLSPAARASGG